MTSNPYFVSYVESIQESLAVFSMTDAEAARCMQMSDSINNYQPKFLICEILFNYRYQENGKSVIKRRFDPHVSDRLLNTFQPESLLDDVRRLYANAQYRNLDWQSVKWQSPESDEFGVSNLAQDMKILDEIFYNKIENLEIGAVLSQSDLDEIKRIITKLIKRYEIEFIPTNFGATAIIYEAWKLGHLYSLGNYEVDSRKFQQMIDGLFICDKRRNTKNFLLTMANNLGLKHLIEIEKSKLRNGKIWTRRLYDDPSQSWFGCVERSLIHKMDYQDDQRYTADDYLIHYPIIIDNYWFVGMAYLFAKWDNSVNMRNPQLLDKPEIFQREKYFKLYNVIQKVSETLKFSLKFDALSKVQSNLNSQLELSDLFLETVKDYFVCFNVSKTGEPPNKSTTNEMLVYSNHGVDIYAPCWLTEKHKDLIHEELDVSKKIVGIDIPKLYEELQQKMQKAKEIQMVSREEITKQVAHQSAGLVAEVWDDPARTSLKLSTESSLWQLKSLIDIWGNSDLKVSKNISEEPEPDFPEWEAFTNKQVFHELINISLRHALRRATYTRTSKERTDEQTQQYDIKTVDRALEISGKLEAVTVFSHEILEKPLEEAIEWLDRDYPEWLRWRGFAICFHHCFWQAAYHAFRAKCAGQSSPYLCIQVSHNQVIIKNCKIIKSFQNKDLHDSQFFEFINKRMQGIFNIKILDIENDFWYTVISKK
ncbi:hypothetical protein [Nostoc sp. TCL26-01]|uniref:hypothetical protein n=1 Tax=Nostoc sp. TCL26-01 TaxID=2576904 RepID=UPI0015BF4177|nr:hypothetical protein [Nostoc sp. TCL26-01]QLE57460.1 hypothetical protein FD725_19235 [Nostoc sp. TCL26-01]